MAWSKAIWHYLSFRGIIRDDLPLPNAITRLLAAVVSDRRFPGGSGRVREEEAQTSATMLERQSFWGIGASRGFGNGFVTTGGISNKIVKHRSFSELRGGSREICCAFAGFASGKC
ncbi:MAG TPA: hypothetical protein VGK74_06210 [Symbiobacteriaceae bacterium]|jgi:hypothetical protein